MKQIIKDFYKHDHSYSFMSIEDQKVKFKDWSRNLNLFKEITYKISFQYWTLFFLAGITIPDLFAFDGFFDLIIKLAIGLIVVLIFGFKKELYLKNIVSKTAEPTI